MSDRERQQREAWLDFRSAMDAAAARAKTERARIERYWQIEVFALTLHSKALIARAEARWQSEIEAAHLRLKTAVETMEKTVDTGENAA